MGPGAQNDQHLLGLEKRINRFAATSAPLSQPLSPALSSFSDQSFTYVYKMSTFTECYGKNVSEGVAKLPEWIQLGCQDGIEENGYVCEGRATFTYNTAELPDLSGHNNFITDLLKEKPGLWEKYMKGGPDGGPIKTSKGNTLAHCLKTGIDNKGHPNIKTVGLVACDEECFELFKEVFDPIISARHNGYASDAKHVTNMNPDDISATKIDPDGKYLLTSRCRTGRSISGFNLPPTVKFQERREQEKLIVEALSKLDGELKGQYLPLRGNKSGVRADMAEGMSEEQEEALRNNGNLFQEPDSTLLLSSGCGRHWPDARGIFKNENENFFVWCNEEDQMRIVSMEKGDNIHAIFKRFANATKVIEEVFEKDGRTFMKNDHLGYVLTCPSNLGTGLRAGAIVAIPLFSARSDFKELLGMMKLQARGTAGVDSVSNTGKFDISNADRLGYSEVDLVNRFIEGVRHSKMT